MRRFLSMARITVEDCLGKIGDDNRFSLVHLAVERVKQRRQGAPLLIPVRKNKEVVMALREIAAGEVKFENILILPKLEDELAARDAENAEGEDVQAEVEAA
jgi:DNA-directed RNA polymerase subunit omega